MSPCHGGCRDPFRHVVIGFFGHFAYRRKGRLSDTWLRHVYFNENLHPWIRYAPLNLLLQWLIRVLATSMRLSTCWRTSLDSSGIPV